MDAPRPSRAKQKTSRKLTARSLENAALHYLKRYASTTRQLETVLMRRVEHSLRAHEQDRAEAMGWVTALIEKLVRNGLVNDAAYAEMKAQSLRASGRSARVIAQKLRLKGVSQELVTEKLDEVKEAISEEEAARTWARKRRLGPYRATPELRAERRDRDLAALARAGFSYSVAKTVIDG